MSDLIEKYFREDLTEAEDKALGELLSSSDDAAQRFGAMAEAKYASYGLPEPGISDAVTPDTSFLKPWMIPAAALLIAGGATWWMTRGAPCPSEVSAPAVVAPVPEEPAQAAPKSDVPRKVTKPSLPSPKAPTAEVVSEPPPALSAIEPPPETAANRESYPKTRVVVNRSTSGIVTVRVIGPDGTVVRKMYEGLLQAGRWSFDWDGRLDDGRGVSPGRYRIEVVSGGSVQSREVLIR